MNGTPTNDEFRNLPSEEECESNLSALIDGELEPETLLPTLDRLVRSEKCRDFFMDSRDLQERLGAGSYPVTEPVLSEELWNKIQRREKSGRQARVLHLLNWSSPVWAAAAAIFLVMGLWSGGFVKFSRLFHQDEVISVQLEENEGKMDEDRFVEITAELLQADRRYHRKMLDVMEAVDGRAFVEESKFEDSPPSYAAQETPTTGTSTPSQSGSNLADLIDIRLW